MMSSKGFTLIELVIVVVILGVLAVTAFPRFMNMTETAENSVVEGTAGAFKEATRIVALRWQADGRPTTAIDIDGDGNLDVCVEDDVPVPKDPSDCTAGVTDAGCKILFDNLMDRSDVPLDTDQTGNTCVFVYDDSNTADGAGSRIVVVGGASGNPNFVFDHSAGTVSITLQ